MSTLRTRELDDRGITLVELIIYMLLAGVFLVIVSSIFISGWISQASTADRDRATGAANAVTASLQQSARNAVALRVPDTRTLVATVATGDSTTTCRAWKIDGDRLMYKAQDAPFALTVDTSWTQIVDGVQVGPEEEPDRVFDAATTAAGQQAAYDMTFTYQSATVSVAGGLAAQAKVKTGATGC